MFHTSSASPQGRKRRGKVPAPSACPCPLLFDIVYPSREKHPRWQPRRAPPAYQSGATGRRIGSTQNAIALNFEFRCPTSPTVKDASPPLGLPAGRGVLPSNFADRLGLFASLRLCGSVLLAFPAG